MEADWEYDLGADAPVIDSEWEGFVDLRQTPRGAAELPETAALPALATALVSLNHHATHLFTSKCDVWRIEDLSSFDPGELDADPESTSAGAACYIDLQPDPDRPWTEPRQAEDWCRWVCSGLRARRIAQCRVDLIVRASTSSRSLETFAVTAYATACGRNYEDALDVLSTVLTVFADAIVCAGEPSAPPSKLQ